MLRLRGLALAGCVLAVGTLLVQGQEAELKAIVRQAIDAHGGVKELAKFQAGTTKYKGTINIANKKLDITAETSFQKPDKFRNAMTLTVDDKMIDVLTVYDGKTLWVSNMGTTTEVDDEKVLKDVRETIQAEGGSLLDILKAPYELSAIGDVKVKDQDTIGIRVSKKDQRDINYYFDKKTHLLAKIEMRALNQITKQEANQEKFILEYQDKNGLKMAKRIAILNDGEPFMDIEITETQPAEKLDDSYFAKP